MTRLGEPPFWSYQVEAQAVRTVTLLNLWLVRTEDVGMVVYPLMLTLRRYCVRGLERYVEWRSPYKTHDEAFDSLDAEYGSHCHSWGDVWSKKWWPTG